MYAPALSFEKQALRSYLCQRKWVADHLKYLAKHPDYFEFRIDWNHPLYRALGGRGQHQVNTYYCTVLKTLMIDL